MLRLEGLANDLAGKFQKAILALEGGNTQQLRQVTSSLRDLAATSKSVLLMDHSDNQEPPCAVNVLALNAQQGVDDILQAKSTTDIDAISRD